MTDKHAALEPDWMRDDPAFGAPWIDVDEWRDAPLRHRYVHGGFEDTNTLFEFRFPEPEIWQGRMLQLLAGGLGGSEKTGGAWGRTVAPDGTSHFGLQLAAVNGAYFVECNQGWRAELDEMPEDLSILSYRANAQAARYSARLAIEMYGRPPEWKYLTGWSGGGMRSISALENTDVYDGAVGGGIVVERQMVRDGGDVGWAVVTLGDLLPAIADATDVGGSADPFALLTTDEQRSALEGLYRVGFQHGTEFTLVASPIWTSYVWLLPLHDPSYVTDFWEKPGYEGHDGKAARLQGTGVVDDVPTVPFDVPVRHERPGIRLRTDLPVRELVGSHVTVTAGPRTGAFFVVTAASGDVVFTHQPDVVRPGDEVSIDNSTWVAMHHYRFYAEQRESLVREVVALPFTGRLNGKMIFLEGAQDLPRYGDIYARQVTDTSRFRFWWMDHAEHGPAVDLPPARRWFGGRYIDWTGFIGQGLPDLIRWVEDGVEPPSSTTYRFDDMGLLHFPASASERGGIQPVVAVTANGEARADVRVGETFVLEASAETPPGAGKIVDIAWDVEGTGDWVQAPVDPSATVVASTKHAYDTPGVHFAGLRVRSHRDGDPEDRPRMIESIGRVRIVVS